MDDTCVVCAETLEWVAYGPCGHREVCSTCVARLRFICKDRRCCLCKFESSTVFVTRALGDYTMVVKDFSTLPADSTEGRVGEYWYHEGTQAYFDDLDHFKMIKATCKLTCSECDKEYENSDKKSRRRGAFADIEKLKSHLFHRHKLSMCNLCLEGRKVFICEQKLFTRAQLSQHISTGDSVVDGDANERGGFKGHPSCQFCRNQYYGDNELYLHMSTEHYTCHICLRRRPGQYDYFNSYDDLENHFRADHYLCEDETCLAKKFVVFAAESEIKRHNALEHGGQMSRSKRNAALQIPVSFQFRETSEQERRRRRRGPHLNSTDNHPSVANEADNDNQSTNGFSLLDASADPAVAPSHQDTRSNNTLVGRFEALATSDTPVHTARQTSLEASSFPPLPTAEGSSRKTYRNKSGKPTIAEHLRRQNHLDHLHRQSNLSANLLRSNRPPSAHNVSRTWSVINQQAAVANNGMSQHATPAPDSSSRKPISADNPTASSSLRNVQPSRDVAQGALTIGVASSSSSSSQSVSASRSEGRPVNSALSIPSASTQQKGKAPADSQPSLQVKNVQHANKLLVEKIRATLQFDDDKYAAFKAISVHFRQGLMDTGEYILHVHQFGLADLIPELARLLPDSEKQNELIDTYNYNVKRNGFHKDGVGQDTSHLMRSRKGKEKCQDNGISSSKDGSSPAVVIVSEQNGSMHPQPASSLPISEPLAGGKKQKKKSKFLQARLGD